MPREYIYDPYARHDDEANVGQPPFISSNPHAPIFPYSQSLNGASYYYGVPSVESEWYYPYGVGSMQTSQHGSSVPVQALDSIGCNGSPAGSVATGNPYNSAPSQGLNATSGQLVQRRISPYTAGPRYSPYSRPGFASSHPSSTVDGMPGPPSLHSQPTITDQPTAMGPPPRPYRRSSPEQLMLDARSPDGQGRATRKNKAEVVPKGECKLRHRFCLLSNQLRSTVRRKRAVKPRVPSKEPESAETAIPPLSIQDSSADSLPSHHTSKSPFLTVQIETVVDPSLILHLPFRISSPLDLPELLAAERRDPIDYKPLKAYGFEEEILTYPHTFQASLHRYIHSCRLENLQLSSYRLLFVYGSLMISCLNHDIFRGPEESPFCWDIVFKCMVPAYLNDYRRYKVRDSDEPAALQSYRKANGGRIHGMIIFGLASWHFEILDRYLERGFIRQEVSVQVPLQKGHLATKLAQAYVIPQRGAMKEVAAKHNLITDTDDPWTVPGFWKTSKICREWREQQVMQL